MRFFVERIRTDPLYIPGTGLRISMILSAVMVIGSIIALLVLRQRMEKLAMARALAGESEYNDAFGYASKEEKRNRQQVDIKQSKATANTSGIEQERAFIPLDELDAREEAAEGENNLEAETAEGENNLEAETDEGKNNLEAETAEGENNLEAETAEGKNNLEAEAAESDSDSDTHK